VVIEQLESAGLGRRITEFAELLVDCVAGGASVGFLPPLSVEDAVNYWRGVGNAIEAGTRVLLAALEDGRLCGTVQLDLPAMANGRHRAEVMKLLVSTQARRRGIGAKLMERVEMAARERDRSLLVLDTKTGDAAERLYRKIGYETAGIIPGYALDHESIPRPTTILYRRIDRT
jgi:acetyltransferase